MGIVFLITGSNLENRKMNLDLAVKELREHPKIEVLDGSSIYETEPYGVKEQPWFLNQAVKIKTELSPFELMDFLKKTEVKLGRVETFRLGPRIIDLDILLYDDLILESENLIIPHSQMQQRRFVLVPLAEIAPNLIHPVSKKSIKRILEQLEDKAEVRLYAGN